jgi:hypothetical protein
MTNAIKVLLQMQNGFLQLESTIVEKVSDKSRNFVSDACAFLCVSETYAYVRSPTVSLPLSCQNTQNITSIISIF